MLTVLANGGFGVVEVEPGKHTISYGPESDPEMYKLEFTVAAGSVAYFQLHRGLPDMFNQVSEVYAKRALKNGHYKYQGLPDKKGN